jgi:hypothetical protein
VAEGVAVDVVTDDGAEAAVFVVTGRVVVGAGALGAGSTIATDGVATFWIRFGTATFFVRPTLARAGLDIEPVVMGPSFIEP